MDAYQIIEYIRTSEKKTPVKVYVWEKTPVDFPNCHVFPAAPGCKLVFGDWKDVAPVLKAHKFDHLEIENDCRNSAIPLLDLKDIPARIEPGAYIREQVEIGKNAVIMMGAVLNIGAVVGEGTMIDMGAVLGGRATVGKNCHVGGRGGAPLCHPGDCGGQCAHRRQRRGHRGLPHRPRRGGGRRSRGGVGCGPQHRGGRLSRPGHQGEGRKNRCQDRAGRRPAGTVISAHFLPDGIAWIERQSSNLNFRR